MSIIKLTKGLKSAEARSGRSRFMLLMLLCMTFTIVQAQQTIKMKVSPTSSKDVTILVNQTKSGVTVDWGDGNAVPYSTNEKGLNVIQGSPKGEEITLTGNNMLRTLVCADNDLTSLVVTGAPYLQSLYCQDNQLKELLLTKSKALKDLNCANNQLTKIGITAAANPDLETLNVSGNALGNVSGSSTGTTFNPAFTKLQYADVSGNGKIKIVRMTSNTMLDYLDCSDNNVTTFALPTDGPTITSLVAENNSITSLGTTTLTAIHQLYADNNAITELPLKEAKNLKEVSAANNQLTSVTLPSHKMRIVNYPNNKLYFNSLPRTLYTPEYVCLLPQNPFPLTGLKTYSDYQYAELSPGYAERTNADYYVDMSALLSDFNGQNRTNLSFVSLDDPANPVEFVRVTRSDGEGDFVNYSSGKISFLTPHYRVVAKLTHTNKYTEDLGYVFYSEPFAVSLEYAQAYVAGLTNVYADNENGLNVRIGNGQIHVRSDKDTQVNIYTIDGKRVWSGFVGKKGAVIRLLKGIYMVNNKKVIL